MQAPWYKQTKYIIPLIIFVFPLGLYLMWKYLNWSKNTKITISILISIVAIIALATSDSATPSKTATPPSTVTDTSVVQAPSTTEPVAKTEQQILDDLLFEAEVTCVSYAETYFKVKDVNVGYDQSSIKHKNEDGSLLIKANIADSQGLIRQEKTIGTMECTTSSDGMKVTDFLAY